MIRETADSIMLMLEELIKYVKHEVEYAEDYTEIIKLIENIKEIENAIKSIDTDTRVW